MSSAHLYVSQIHLQSSVWCVQSISTAAISTGHGKKRAVPCQMALLVQALLDPISNILVVSEMCFLRYFACVISNSILDIIGLLKRSRGYLDKKPSSCNFLGVKTIIMEGLKAGDENMLFHLVSFLSVAFKAVKKLKIM